MKISVVKSFLCFELETGGRILGWLGIIGGVLLFLFAGLLMTILSLLSCKELYELMKDDELQDLFPEISITDCQFLKAFLIIAAIFILVYSIISTILNVLLLIGIQKCDPGKIIPSVVIQGVATFTIVFRGLTTFSLDGIIGAVVLGCIAYYIFLVLYSLYVKIRDEKVPQYDSQLIFKS